MTHRDELVRVAEDLAGQCKDPAMTNELKRVAVYTQRHHDYNQMLRLLSANLPPRGRAEQKRWQALQRVLTDARESLAPYPPEERAFILAAAARVLAYQKPSEERQKGQHPSRRHRRRR